MTDIPVNRTTVDLTTGEETQETVHFNLRPAPPGTCPECAKDHDATHPHNAQSMFYQYHFYATHERWPDWRDAMAHCTEEMQKLWTAELTKRGVDVAGGKVHPSK